MQYAGNTSSFLCTLLNAIISLNEIEQKENILLNRSIDFKIKFFICHLI